MLPVFFIADQGYCAPLYNILANIYYAPLNKVTSIQPAHSANHSARFAKSGFGIHNVSKTSMASCSIYNLSLASVLMCARFVKPIF